MRVDRAVKRISMESEMLDYSNATLTNKLLQEFMGNITRREENEMEIIEIGKRLNNKLDTRNNDQQCPAIRYTCSAQSSFLLRTITQI